MTEMVQPILVTIITASVLGISNIGFKNIKKERSGHTRIEKGMVALLKSQMMSMYNREEFDDENKQVFYEMYAIYTGLGGNGYLRNIKEKIDRK